MRDRAARELVRGSSAVEATDAELLARVANGDLSALGTLFDRHHVRVERVLRNSGIGPSDRDDLVQRTFLELLRTAGDARGADHCGAWLCGIALRLAARHRRSVRRLLAMLASFAQEVVTVHPTTPETEVQNKREIELFAVALAALGARKREAIMLVEIEGFTAEEVGRVLGVSPATVRTRVFYARAELREMMERGE